MTLTAADVAEIVRLVEQSGFDELNLEIDGMKLSLRRGTPAQTAAVGAAQGGQATSATAPLSALGPSPSPAAAPLQPLGAAPPGTTASASTPGPLDPDVHEIPSPLLGTFYRAPKPGAQPFVEVGAQVEEDTVVAIIEVMKLMNTVRAGIRGTVIDVLVADGALAEYGEPLMRVRKSG